MRKHVESQAALTSHHSAPLAWRSRCALALLASLAIAGNAVAAPCFTVDASKVTVNQLFATGVSSHLVDLEDMPSVSTMVSRGTESHNLVFMNVKRDAAKKNVTAFAAKIDDKAYEFPNDSCSKK